MQLSQSESFGNVPCATENYHDIFSLFLSHECKILQHMNTLSQLQNQVTYNDLSGGSL